MGSPLVEDIGETGPSDAERSRHRHQQARRAGERFFFS